MKISEKRELLISQITNLQVYTIKTPLIGQFPIKMVFLVQKNVLLEDLLHQESKHALLADLAQFKP